MRSRSSGVSRGVPDPFIRRQSVIALGHFEDPAAVALLIELLGAPEAGIRENAAWSLRKISGEPFPVDAKRWKLWYDGEMRWWEEPGRRLLDSLDSADQQVVLAAIHEISEHPFFRNLVHGALARLAKEGNTRVAGVAADAPRPPRLPRGTTLRRAARPSRPRRSTPPGTGPRPPVRPRRCPRSSSSRGARRACS